MDVSQAVASRRSVRAFTDAPVDLATIRTILDKARWAPSGCNYQPWEAIVLTGAPLKALQDVLLAAKPDEPLEYPFDLPSQSPKYDARIKGLGQAMYGAMAIGRDDKSARQEFARQNLVSFGAPVLLLCHFPKFMGSAQWSDIGMWLQTIMLLVREAGLDSCPQEYMGIFGRTIKRHLGLPDDELLFCGIAIGTSDPDAPINSFERERVPLDEHVRFLGF